MYKLTQLILTICLLAFSINAQNWEQLGDSPFLRHHSNGFGFNGKGYLMLGTNNGNFSNEVWEYNPDSDNWQQLNDFPGVPRSIAIGDEWNGKFYYGFGSSQSGYLNDLWEFDPLSETFTQLPSCPCQGRSHPAFIAYQDKIFMGSGSTNNGDLDDWWVYDITSQVWTQKIDIPGGNRHHPFFFESGDFVYVGGGHRTNWLSYDLNNESWSTIDNEPQGRVAGTQLSYNGNGLIIAGDDLNHVHVPDNETFMMYNTTNQEWEYLPELPNGSRWAPSSFIIDDILYFFGGLAFGAFSNDQSVWKFDLSFINCSSATDLNATNITEDAAALFWFDGNGIISDTLKWKKVEDVNWTDVPNPTAVYALENLEPCQDYEFTIVSECESLIANSDIFTFKTKGCGSCIDLNYCAIPNASSSTGNGYIDEITLNEYTNNSGFDGGYGNFSIPTGEAVLFNDTFQLSIKTVKEASFMYDLDIYVWIDLNTNGNFDSNENVWIEPNASNDITLDILIPNNAALGDTRMRIAYVSTDVANITACFDAYNNANITLNGEVEDYCINIVTQFPTNIENYNVLNDISIYVNSSENNLNFKHNTIEQLFDLNIINSIGSIVKTEKNYDLANALSIQSLPAGLYVVQIMDKLNNDKKLKFIK